MKKILFIHHAAGWGGAPINMINIITSLDKSKYSPFVLLLKDSMVKEKLAEKNIPYKVADSAFYKKHYKYFSHSEAGYISCFNIYRLVNLTIHWLLSRYYFALKELSALEFDIVHLNSSVLTDWLSPCKKKASVIIHFQEPLAKGCIGVRTAFIKKILKKYADHIIAISEDNANRVGLPDKTTIVYNFSKIPEKEPDPASYLSKGVLYLGGSSKIKGFTIIAEALNYLEKDVKLYFGGDYSIRSRKGGVIKQIIKFIIGYEKRKVKAIQKMKMHQNAIEIGMISDVDKYLHEVCCLIAPFTVPHFARPVIEAYLNKKPAIGTDVEGMDEIISHNSTGLIIKKNNPKALANAINYLTNNPNISRSMGEKGYRKAINIYSQNNIQIIENIYDNLSK